MKPALCLRFSDTKGHWIIYDADKGINGTILWKRLYIEDEDTQERGWPADMRAEYEKLLGRPEFVDQAKALQTPNLVELVADEDDCAWDQKCIFGHRVDSHAVYCHNEHWLYAPTKCRRGSPDHLHERCPGFVLNPLYKPETNS